MWILDQWQTGLYQICAVEIKKYENGKCSIIGYFDNKSALRSDEWVKLSDHDNIEVAKIQMKQIAIILSEKNIMDVVEMS